MTSPRPLVCTPLLTEQAEPAPPPARAAWCQACTPPRARRRPVAQACTLASLAGLALLAACNGGDSDPALAPTPTPPATVSQTVKVIDGAIRGATVCLDKNANGACDTGEPGGVTAADGTATFTVDAADANKHPVLALVGTDAVDADHGPVTVAFSLQAPADQPAIVSPLSTLVVAQAAAGGQTTAEAASAVQQALGLGNNVLADFTAAGGDPAALNAARLLVLATQQQLSATAEAKAADGSALSKADLAQAVQAAVLNNLPSLAAALASPAVANAATASERAAALGAAATGFASTHGLTASSAAAVVAAARSPVSGEATGETSASAGLTLRWLDYTDPGNYNFRSFKSTAEQNTVVNGLRRFTEYSEQARANQGVNTFYMQWGEGLNNWPRNLRYWNGSTWFDCPTNQVHEASAWDAQGASTSSYCGVFKSRTLRRARDISGLKLVDVVKDIRAYPLKDGAVAFSYWGPDPEVHAAALGGTFPTGSLLYHYTSTETAAVDQQFTNADLYVPYLASVTSGDASACNQVTIRNTIRWQDDNAITLDKLIARSSGTPCVYSPRSTASGSVPNEWWGATTVLVGDFTVAYTDPDGYFRSNVRTVRASFTGSGNTVRYWSCLRRSTDGSPRNCTALGSGSYRIDTLGNSRVLRLLNPPAETAGLNYDRTFVEVDGQVWYGSRTRPATSYQQRLNLRATEALFAALAIPAPRSASPLTADSLLRDYTSHQARVTSGGFGWVNPGALAHMPQQANGLVGAWTLSATQNPRAQTFWFFEDGRFVMADPVGDTGPSSCGGPGYELGTYQLDAATGQLSITGITLDTNLCAGTHDSTDGSRLRNAPVVFAADGKSLTLRADDGETVRLYRLAP